MPEKPDDNTLYLLDAMALAYRAHYIFISRPLINSDGQNTSAAYGFTNSLLKLIEEHGMEHLAVVFDAAGEEGTFREDIYPDYKVHRDPPPDELLENLPYIKKIVRALDIPVIEEPGVEADDVIGTLARRAEADGAEVVIVSPDKDFQQLLSDRISIHKPARRGESFDPITPDTFREEYDLEPHQFIDMLALWGDSSDNVPGVRLIGEKTSAKLLREYGDVDNVIAHADDVGGKRGESLTENAEDARMSKRLVTIKTDLDLGFDWKHFAPGETDADTLVTVFKELEFDSLLERAQEDDLLPGDAALNGEDEAESEDDPALTFDFGEYEEVTSHDADAVDYLLIEDEAALRNLAEDLLEYDALSFDVETTSTDKMEAELVGLSFAWAEGEAAYAPTPLPDGTSEANVLEALAPVLESDALKIGHNLKYDLSVLRRAGADAQGPLFDTMVAHYLLAPEAEHGLDAVARKYLSYRMIPIEDLIGEDQDGSMRDVDPEEAMPYACEDADVAFQLKDKLRDGLDDNDLLGIAEDIEFPLVPVLSAMELRGIRLDRSVLDDISDEIEGEMEALKKKLHDEAGEEFNPNSPKQLREILFDKLDLEPRAKTSTGKPSTKESVLQALSTEHDLPGLVLDWRGLSKLKSTYVDSLGELVHPDTGRIHTDFNQAVTATGRLSSSNPNLQNIPVRTERGREVRRAFVPQDGWQLIAADYEQIELRILAAASGDDALRQVFRDEEDVHTTTAARVFGKDPGDVTSDERRKAKEVNYAIPYGISPWGLAQRLRSSADEAQELIDEYRRSYPAVSRYLAEQVEKARERGYAETMLGRRRYVPDIDSSNSRRRGFAERVAVNMPIQGTQADMIKIAMVRLRERLARDDHAARMLLQVHDELVLEAPPDALDSVRPVIRETMEEAYPLPGDVPVAVALHAADNWLDAH
jgi:DNA polymerase-1